jgi:hypothetical protein
MGVAVSNVYAIALVLACGLAVFAVLARTVSRRLVQARGERLKAHLDWVNPAPQTSRKRGLARR